MIPATDVMPVMNLLLDVEFAQLSDAGQTRENNEDYVDCVLPANSEAAQTQGWLFALADGVGGQAAGEVASRTAVDRVVSGFKAAAGEPLPGLLSRLIQDANAEVYRLGKGSSAGRPMATTLVLCALRYDRAVIAHAGDSRCYLIRDGVVEALTRDHTVAGEQARLGLVSAHQAPRLHTRHLLTRSVGNDLVVSADCSEHAIVPDDLFLLCSDGLHNSVLPADIARVVGKVPDLAEAARQLVALANERDGKDNITVQLIRVRSVERMGMYRGRPYKLQ